jgi:4-hydroxybenzoate polyprenyltransferase
MSKSHPTLVTVDQYNVSRFFPFCQARVECLPPGIIKHFNQRAAVADSVKLRTMQTLSPSSESLHPIKDALSKPEPLTHQRRSYIGTRPHSTWISPSILIYHLHTIWLFTYTDLKTIVFPSSAFGILTALSLSLSGAILLPPFEVIQRLPTVLFWTWLNLLPFNIGNQRQAGAIIEDKQNKPWRPVISGRLTPKQAKYLQLAIYPIVFLVSAIFGGTPQSLVLVLLEYLYNDLEGSERSCVTRNVVNASGFTVYSSGALAVALKGTGPLSATLYQWKIFMGAVVASTGHSQDMADQAGDRLRNRKTVPLVVGDGVARWTIAVPTAFWTVAAPRFWNLGVVGSLVQFVIGWTVILRTIIIRDVAGDKRTFQIWNLWMVSLYLLPLIRAYTMLQY